MTQAPVFEDEFTRATRARAAFFVRLGQNLEKEPMALGEFFDEAWNVLEPSTQLVRGWHIDCMLDHLQAVELGQIKDLFICVPPRMTKTLTVSVIWPSWSWTHSPWLRYVRSSYSASLAIKINLDCRDLIKSPWYQQNWGDLVHLKDDQDQKMEFQNTARGYMIAMGVGGSVTGKGGERLVVDDLLNPEMAESKADRMAALGFWDRTLCSRLNDKINGVRVVVCQRLHRQDLIGHIAREKGWTGLVLPSEAPVRHVIKFPVSGRKVTREQGDLLSPERESQEVLNKIKERNVRVYNAQHQQNPSADDSDFFLRSNWRYYTELPTVLRSVWGWDTAVGEKDVNDYSAGFHVNECADGFYISRKRYHARVPYGTLKADFKNEVVAQPAEAVVVENKSSGQQLNQEMQAETSLPVIAMDVSKDKVYRASLISPYQQAHKIFLPEGEPWVPAFVEMCQNFPDVDFDDEMDAFTAAMLYLTGKLKGGLPGLTVSNNGNGHLREDGEIVETDLTPELIQQRLREAAGVALNGGNGNGHD